MRKCLIKLEEKHASISNAILNAAYELSIVERRILFITLSHMNSKEEIISTQEYDMSVEDYAELCDIKDIRKAYDIVKEGVKNVFDRYITIKGIDTPKSITHFRWVQSIKFIPEEHKVKIKWSEDIIPFISSLNGSFTKLINRKAIPIEGKYTARLYDLLEQERFKGLQGVKYILVEDLISSWCVPESLRPYKYLKSTIILPAIKELERRELAKVELKEQKDGRKVIAVLFVFILEK